MHRTLAKPVVAACPDQPIIWFAESFQVREFQQRGIPVKDSANLDIVCYETLAQVALVVAFATACRGQRMRVKIPSWSDNSGTEAVCHKVFTTAQPLARLFKPLRYTHGIPQCSWMSRTSPDVIMARLLSRWDGTSLLPPEFHADYRIRCPLNFCGIEKVIFVCSGMERQPPFAHCS